MRTDVTVTVLVAVSVPARVLHDAEEGAHVHALRARHLVDDHREVLRGETHLQQTNGLSRQMVWFSTKYFLLAANCLQKCICLDPFS